MIKKISIAVLILALGITMVGCGSVPKKQYDNLKKVQESFLKQNSCHLIINSKVGGEETQDANITDFVFKVNDKGVMEYCQSQQDGSNKLVFCEYGDGEKAEQWLLGNGWSTINPVAYSKDNPHKYINLLTNSFDKKAISKLSKETELTNTSYILEMDAKKLNKTVYKDTSIEIVSQKITYLVNANGNLICYNDVAVIYDKEADTKAEYQLEVQVSDHNAVTEIKKPEVRVNAIVQAEK